MSDTRPTRIIGDLGDLPTSAQGSRHIVWWGNLGFMLIEGTGFLLAAGAYLYLLGRSSGWPPPGDPLPGLGWSTAFTAGLVLSAVPNLWLQRQVRRKRAGPVRWGSLGMTLIGLALIGVRALEIDHLNVDWDGDAYGSAVWLLMLLHTTHIVTDWGDTAVQAMWLHTHVIGDDQFADVEDNCNYWSFVVLSWLPIYALLYWVPRWV